MHAAQTHPSSSPFDLEAAMALVPQSLIDSLPRDQALGLRLIALARAAAAMHMAETVRPRHHPHAERGNARWETA